MSRPVLVAGLLTMAACSDAQAPEVPPNAALLPAAVLEDLTPFRFHSGFEGRERLVIRDPATWERTWRALVAAVQPAPPVPAVDFTRDMVVLAAMGTRRSGGFVIDVEGVYDGGGRVYAAVLETSPGAGCAVTLAITTPVAAVRVPRRDGPVTFVERSRTVDC
jgi:hypothetical protein